MLTGKCIDNDGIPSLVLGGAYQLDPDANKDFVYVVGLPHLGTILRDRFKVDSAPCSANPKKAFGDAKAKLALIPPAADTGADHTRSSSTHNDHHTKHP